MLVSGKNCPERLYIGILLCLLQTTMKKKANALFVCVSEYLMQTTELTYTYYNKQKSFFFPANFKEAKVKFYSGVHG